MWKEIKTAWNTNIKHDETAKLHGNPIEMNINRSTQKVTKVSFCVKHNGGPRESFDELGEKKKRISF